MKRLIRRMMPSLRIRLFVLIVTPLLGGATLLGLWRFNEAQATAEELFDRALETLARDIRFAFERESRPVSLHGDRTLLVEAVTNLIDNTLSHGGASLSNIMVRTHIHEGRAAIDVVDDGKGLQGVDGAVVFSRFHQLDGDAGSGLGLSITQKFADMYGSENRALDTTRGTYFRIALSLS